MKFFSCSFHFLPFFKDTLFIQDFLKISCPVILSDAERIWNVGERILQLPGGGCRVLTLSGRTDADRFETPQRGVIFIAPAEPTFPPNGGRKRNFLFDGKNKVFLVIWERIGIFGFSTLTGLFFLLFLQWSLWTKEARDTISRQRG